MPELPEVETTLRGIAPQLHQQTITNVIIRQPRLRWPIPADLDRKLSGKQLVSLHRRAKYLVFNFTNGSLILHLGMSGRLRMFTQATSPQKHDHADFNFANGVCLRFTDPRRFGAILWTEEAIEKHNLLADIGPEPLSSAFSGQYLYQRAKGKKASVKAFIMDSHIVAGVGNIYATEALFMSQVKPQKSAGKVSLAQYQALAKAIKTVLKHAIKKGGTTLKDFMNSDGAPGYFSIELKVYGREGKECVQCNSKLKLMRIAQRSTVYCSVCQK